MSRPERSRPTLTLTLAGLGPDSDEAPRRKLARAVDQVPVGRLRGLRFQRTENGYWRAVVSRDNDIEIVAFRWPAGQAPSHALSVALRFRLVPAPGVQPGTYAWPIQLQGHALETAPGP